MTLPLLLSLLTPRRDAEPINRTALSSKRFQQMAKIFSQSIALAFFFPLLFLLPLHELNSAGNIPATFTPQRHSVVDEGNRTLTVRNRKFSDVHNRDGGFSRDVVSSESSVNDTRTQRC